MVTLTSADNALKSVYIDAVAEQLNTSINPLLAKIKKSTQDVWGKEIRRVARSGINGGIGAGTEDGNLPSAAGSEYKQFVTTLKNLYGTIEISDKAVRASENNVGAFVNLLNDEMESLIASSSFNFGRMLFGDGSGILATVTNTMGPIVTLDSMKNVAPGMVVDFLAEADNSLVDGATGRRITSVDYNAKTIFVSGGSLTSVSSGDKICIQGSYGLELTGLGAIFKDTGSLYGIDRVSNKWMIPYMKNSVGDITEEEIQKAIDTVEERSNSRVDMIVCSWGVKRALQKLFSEKNVNTNIEVLAGGYKAMTYNGIPIVADRFCPEGTMYLLNTADFCLHQLCDWKWLEGDDGKVLKQIAGKPTYTATLVKYADLICTRPAGQAMLSGITEA